MPQSEIKNLGSDFIVANSSGINPEIGKLGIDSDAFFEEFVETEAGIVSLEKRSAVCAGGTFKKHIRIRIQPGDHCDFSEACAVFRIQHQTSPRGKHHPTHTHKLG